MYTPCKGCNERITGYPGCHSTCGKYAKFRKNADEEKKKRHNESELNQAVGDLAHNMKTRRRTNGVRLGGKKKQ